MPLTFYRFLFVSLLACVSARADIVTDTETANSSASSVSFSGDFSIPQFDPSLGTLTSVNYLLRTTATLNWDMLTEGPSTAIYVNVRAGSGFLSGGEGTDNVFLAGVGRNGCGISADPQPCEPISTGLAGLGGDCPTVAYGGPLIFPPPATAGCYPSALQTPTDLTSFIGTSTLLLPVTASVTGTSDFGQWTGGLGGSQTIEWDLDFFYGYTPAPQQDPPQDPPQTPATATPEPRWSAALLLSCFAAFRLLPLRKRVA